MRGEATAQLADAKCPFRPTCVNWHSVRFQGTAGVWKAAFGNQPAGPLVKVESQPHAETRAATDQPDRLATIAAASTFPSFRTAAIAGICPLRGREPPVSQP